MYLIVMLPVLAYGGNLPLYVILNHKTVSKEQLPRGIIVRCQPKGCWITNELNDRLVASSKEQKARGAPGKMGCWFRMHVRDI